MLAALHDAGVRFVLIGGMAAVLHGDVGVTVDIDITPARDPDNLERLAAALRALDARIRTDEVPAGLPFERSAAFLRNLGPDGILNLATRAGALDVSFVPAGTAGYDDLKRDAVRIGRSRGRTHSGRVAGRRDPLQERGRPREGPPGAASPA